MPKQKLKKTNLSFSQRFSKPIPVHPIIAIIFILAFIGLGAYTIKQSSAATPWICVNHTYYEGQQYGYCMQDAQHLLNADAKFTGGHTNLYPDGDFGPLTETNVLAVQRYTHHQYGTTVDGILGPQTWAQICRLAYPSRGNAYWDAGCGYTY